MQQNTDPFDFICISWPGTWVLNDIVFTSFIKINNICKNHKKERSDLTTSCPFPLNVLLKFDS
jgi:hypothetical protein